MKAYCPFYGFDINGQPHRPPLRQLATRSHADCLNVRYDKHQYKSAKALYDLELAAEEGVVMHVRYEVLI